MYDELNYEKDARIDENALDFEWLNQAQLAMKYCRNYAYLRKVADRAKENLNVIEAELMKKANEDPVEIIGKAKPTVKDLENYCVTHDEYKEALSEKLEAEHEAKMAELAKNEIAYTRKEALQNMVQLHGQQYFAGPKVPRNLKDLRQKQKEVEKTVTKKTAKGMKRKLKTKERN